jgi:lysozyme family protein
VPIERPRIEPMDGPGLTGKQKAGTAGALAILAALAGVYLSEGGYADHPNDRGGKTMFGVTEKVARSYGYHGAMRDLPKHCATAAMICADRIYTERYIDAPGYRPFASIEPAILYELVDSAVLHGPPKPSGWLQGSLNDICGSGLSVDQKVGKRTVAAYSACQQRLGKVTACVRILDRMDAAQLAYFNAIVARNPSQRVFYRGWTTRRIGNVDRAKCGSGL